MDANTYLRSLKDDELQVECKVRKVDPTIQNLYDHLGSILFRESKSELDPPLNSHLLENPENEIGLARENSEILHKIVIDKDQSIDEIYNAWCRILHWRNRLQRIKQSFGNVHQVTSVLNQLNRLLKLAREKVSDLEAKNKPPKAGDDLNVSNKADIEGAIGGEEEKINFITREYPPKVTNFPNHIETITPLKSTKLHEGITLPNTCSKIEQSNDDYNHSAKNQPRWRIVFDGDSGLDVHDFIFRLETYAKRDGYPFSKLPLMMHSFLTGRAEKWIWVYTREHPDATWLEMRLSIISRFSSYESEKETRRIIERRTQKARESFSDFALDIQTMNGRLTDRISENDLIEILRENMNPVLRTATLSRNFISIESLRLECQRYERIWAESGYDPRNQIEPKRKQLNELSLDLSKIDINPVNGGNESVDEQISALKVNSSRNPYLICWNCKDLGHPFTECKSDKWNRFCYSCGTSGVGKWNCPKCQQNLNSIPSHSQPGDRRSTSSIPRQY